MSISSFGCVANGRPGLQQNEKIKSSGKPATVRHAIDRGGAAIEAFVLIFTGVLIVVLIAVSMGKRKPSVGRMAGRRKPTGRSPVNRQTTPRTCPLCGSRLEKGETVHSVVFGKQEKRSGGMPADRIAHIFGCPHCYPGQTTSTRLCPVCKARIPENGFVIARMFETDEKRHVHVLGCTVCRSRRIAL